MAWYLNKGSFSRNEALTNFLLNHKPSYKEHLVNSLRDDEYSDFKIVNDSILTVLDNSIYSPLEYAKLCKLDTFVSTHYKKYRPTYPSKDSIFRISIWDIKKDKSIYFYKPYFYIYQQSYEAFQQAKQNRYKEGYFYKIIFNNVNIHTTLFNNNIITEQKIFKNNLDQWVYNQKVLNPMAYAHSDISSSKYIIYISNLDGLLSAPITEETIIRAHEESEKIRRQRKE
jgi:hypothetical protein